jgi:prepilin-type N-terminal cleavage/methylation domain-containing protein
MARPNNSNLGFSLIELLTVVIITATLTAIAWPFFQNKVFARTVPQIESTLKVVSLKARANAGNSYRVTLQGNSLLKVDYILNGRCDTPATAAWRQDPAQSFDLPDDVSIPDFPVGGICFDGTGQVSLSPGSVPGTTRSFNIVNNKATSKAVKANISISSIGDITRTTFDSNNTVIPDGKFY